ncbi:MAG: hypothetical protein U9R03_00565 [Candidatus Aerophobetes bacterium]|nr:hypothetical protein [Candidatus Aerophobetes bacterium]
MSKDKLYHYNRAGQASLTTTVNKADSAIASYVNRPSGITDSTNAFLLDSSFGSLPPLEKMPMKKVETKKITTNTIMTFPRKVVAPVGPKTVRTPPPKAAPVEAPLPTCRRIVIISKMQTTI